MIDYKELPFLVNKNQSAWIRFFKKNKKKIENADVFIHDLHHAIVAKTDCLSCGNCCRSLGPRITNKDIERIAKSLRMKGADFISKYLVIDEDNDFIFKSMPCPFLGADNFCAIYDVRPKACSEYPHTDRKKFYQLYMLSVKNASTCPIVYEVLEGINKAV
ncbi:MAG: zinc/iron-chelating domain-containing protein [Porphyromonadaceae bacterium CG2_30_38_12]|nr:MAG: zinc/iron-chelating domain-containing protein [Porphyromonadaceae bacterium CG2_30_38_12]